MNNDPQPIPRPQPSVPPPPPPRTTKVAAAADEPGDPKRKRTVRITLPAKPSAAPAVRAYSAITVRVSENPIAGKPGKDYLLRPLIQQALLVLLSAMVLDGGQMFQIVVSAALAYWGAFLVLAARGRERLTRVDHGFIQWGFLMLCAVSFVLTQAIEILRIR